MFLSQVPPQVRGMRKPIVFPSYESGSDDQEKWTKDVVYEILEKDWEKYDDDKSGDLDSMESYEFF